MQISNTRQEVDSLPDTIVQDDSMSHVPTQPQGHLPLQEHPDGVGCEMVTEAPIMETVQPIDVTGLFNCTFRAAPIFVFRSFLKFHHRPLSFACRSMVQCVDGRLMKRCRNPQGLTGIMGYKAYEGSRCFDSWG